MAAVTCTGEKAMCGECMMWGKCNIDTKVKPTVWVEASERDTDT